MFFTMPSTTCALFQNALSRVFAQCFALGLQQRPPRENDVPPSLVELDDLELVGLTDHPVQVANRAEIDLAAGQEGLDAEQVDGESTLDAPRDRPFDDVGVVVGGGELVPDPEAIRLLLGQDDGALVALDLLDHHLDGVARNEPDHAAVVRELPGGDHALGLVADVDENVVGVHTQHGPLYNVPLPDAPKALLEERLEALFLWSGHRRGSLGFFGHMLLSVSCRAYLSTLSALRPLGEDMVDQASVETTIAVLIGMDIDEAEGRCRRLQDGIEIAFPHALVGGAACRRRGLPGLPGARR